MRKTWIKGMVSHGQHLQKMGLKTVYVRHLRALGQYLSNINASPKHRWPAASALFEPHTFPVNKSLYFIPQAQGRMPESTPFSRSCPFQCLLPVSLIFLPISAQIFHLLGSVFHAPSFPSFPLFFHPAPAPRLLIHFHHLLSPSNLFTHPLFPPKPSASIFIHTEP